MVQIMVSLYSVSGRQFAPKHSHLRSGMRSYRRSLSFRKRSYGNGKAKQCQDSLTTSRYFAGSLKWKFWVIMLISVKSEDFILGCDAV
jgi:hypothetical protein